ncbi:MAG: hypothetical protein ACRC57_02810 [Sarcina sp.]
MFLLITCLIFIVSTIIVELTIYKAINNNVFNKFQSFLLVIGGVLNIIGLYVMKLNHSNTIRINHIFYHIHCEIGKISIVLVSLQIVLGVVYSIIGRKFGKFEKIIFSILLIITILLYLISLILGIYIR